RNGGEMEARLPRGDRHGRHAESRGAPEKMSCIESTSGKFSECKKAASCSLSAVISRQFSSSQSCMCWPIRGKVYIIDLAGADDTFFSRLVFAAQPSRWWAIA